MDDRRKEVLFETRRHASRPYSSNYPPLPHQNENARGSFFSLLRPRGLSTLMEKWSVSRHPVKLKKHAALFISERGDRVAIASGNELTILSKDDDYHVPLGTFSCETGGTFTCGSWSEAHDVFGVADDSDTLYFIRANGEEITRITKNQLKTAFPVIGVVVRDDSDDGGSCLCTFTILTSEGMLHTMDISQNTTASSIFAQMAHSRPSTKKQFPQTVFCLDYDKKLSIFAVVSSGGTIQLSSTGSVSHSLTLWHRTGDSDLEQVVCASFEGFYTNPSGYRGHITTPKVRISPEGKFVAALDMAGVLLVFKFDKEHHSLSRFYRRGSESMCEVCDFAWWSSDIIAIADRSGAVLMIDILSGGEISEDASRYSMPLLEQAGELSGLLFLLETVPSGQCSELFQETKASKMHPTDQENRDKLDYAKLKWSLVSLSKQSVPDMYNILITRKEYEAALAFACQYELDKDEVLKSQWFHSCQGVDETKRFLFYIKDKAFVLSECMEKIGPTEDAMRTLLDYGLHLTDHYRFSESEGDECTQIWDGRIARLKLLQSKDRLETFLGINMGRFSAKEYNKFRNLPISETALALAESGKIGALNLLFKRHLYSLASSMLEVLTAIPETVPVKNYRHLLPGSSPPSMTLREEDWVECDQMKIFINGLSENERCSIQISTEPIVKICAGLQWPSNSDLCQWYKRRATDIDSLSGQLDNCTCLIEFACSKGIPELEQFAEEISYLHHLIYSDDDEGNNIFMRLAEWIKLSDFEKFKLMVTGVRQEIIMKCLCQRAIPFMRKRLDFYAANGNKTESFLVRWMKEISSNNKLDICLDVMEEACKEVHNKLFFEDEAEMINCALQCIYLCSATNKWSTMASILAKLPVMPADEGLKEKHRVAEGHIEAGRLLSLYQVPKPIIFFVEAHSDYKGVKQIFRLILSKFIRRQPAWSDNDWANLWRDLQALQEKAFPFIDPEYVLIEFCRGLLKAGKFSIARNYLRGVGSVALETDKAENLVIQAAREYFYSASSLACSEIWKAKECLNIFPSSRNVRAEADVIDAITVRLPRLGVHLLPMQFKQVKDPMEIVKLAITSQGGAYLDVEEVINIAKLLGLGSQDDISAVQEAIAREAAVVGDLQLAFDTCLLLVKKGHGSVWDLCAALARGPPLDNMDTCSRKQLLGFALSHCDEESISELLYAWKDLDIEGQCETLKALSGTEPAISAQDSSGFFFSVLDNQDTTVFNNWSGLVDDGTNNQVVHNNKILSSLRIATNLSVESDQGLDTFVNDVGKNLSFASMYLPWLLDLIQENIVEHKSSSRLISGMGYVSLRIRAVVTILSWLARNGLPARDGLIASLAQAIMQSPVTEEEDAIGCSFLLNLLDAFYGAQLIEEHLRRREKYEEITSIMNIGIIYCSLHNCECESNSPHDRRELLLKKFQQKDNSFNSDERSQIDKVQSTFWKEWKLKIEEQRRVADESRDLEQIIPGVEAARFLSRDIDYMESSILTLINSLKPEQKEILNNVMQLARTYQLDCRKVLLHYLSSIFSSVAWTAEEISSEVLEIRGDILACAADTIQTISLSVYPAVNGNDKQRLAVMYSLLSDCYRQLQEPKVLHSNYDEYPGDRDLAFLAHFSKIVEQECNRVSFIDELNFKNITGLQDLNIDYFNNEVSAHINERNVDALAKMVQNLLGVFGDTVREGLFSSEDVYKYHILSLLTPLEASTVAETHMQISEDLDNLANELEHAFETCRKYMGLVASPVIPEIGKRFFTVILPVHESLSNFPSDLKLKGCLIRLLSVWLRLLDDMSATDSLGGSFYSDGTVKCLKVFLRLIAEGKVSPSQGWVTVVTYVNYGFTGDTALEAFNFSRAMIFSGCGFRAVSDVFNEVMGQFPSRSAETNSQIGPINIQALPDLYLTMLESTLQDMSSGSLGQLDLPHLFSSLSRLEGDEDNLLKVRDAVWKRMADYSNDFRLPSHVRVHVLEIMQIIAATDDQKHGSSLGQHLGLHPWEGWNSFELTSLDHKNASADGVSATVEVASRVTSKLVALRSSQLVSTISTYMEITPEDLVTVKSAVSCFLRVSESATSESHIGVLLAMLKEWEGLFRDVKLDKGPIEDSDGGNGWNNDDWDEGWESFQDEPIDKEMNKGKNLEVHPLHGCWQEIFKKLLFSSNYRQFLKLIDQYTAETECILLDEEDTRCLAQIALEVDCFLALKVVLFFPYEAVQLACLDSVENSLKRDGVSERISRDHEFLVLVLSSSVISAISSRQSYGTTFSFICYLVGNLSRQCQERHLSSLVCGEATETESTKNPIYIFTRILLPSLVAELVRAEQDILAAFLVTKFMHTHASLSLLNVAEASLRRYLERQLQLLKDDALLGNDIISFEPLTYTLVKLKGRLNDLIQSALSLLPVDVR